MQNLNVSVLCSFNFGPKRRAMETAWGRDVVRLLSVQTKAYTCQLPGFMIGFLNLSKSIGLIQAFWRVIQLWARIVAVAIVNPDEEVAKCLP